MSPHVSRRVLLGGAAATAAAAGAGALALRRESWPGTLGGADAARGHKLRDGRFPPPAETRETGIAIVGGGVAGLAAAWALAEAGHENVTLFELEDQPGGNARSGRNAVSAFPLGAHYLPIPNAEATSVRHLLERLGIITGWSGGKPIFDPYQVVADLDERLLRLGRWQEGLEPSFALSPGERRESEAFFAAMANYRAMRGRDGRPAFALPATFSSRDAELLALDRISFATWLDRKGFRSPALRAHLRYCCRDDYGCEPEHTSAWAGIHYFAGRRGEAANVDGDAVLTWPSGNGHLTQAMARRVASRISGGQVVHAVRTEGAGAVIDSYDVAAGRTIRWQAQAAIVAAPRFVAARLVGGSAEGFSYAPWVVANVTVDRLPRGPGTALAWDNVSSTSPSLGYVVATHQSQGAVDGPTVLTWYDALSSMPPAAARRLMLSRPLGEWQRLVADDLLAMNPDLKGAIRRIDVWRWGHGMIRPVPGFLWGAAREAAAEARPPLFFAHSDLSGLSLFEEAHYRGTLAAEQAMAHLGRPFTSLLA
ncbi:FAD-dependent oxidoreductase [Sphingomonas jatrophae]|uniref:NAD(P)-binding Rossmann-like domain-containing protein n=1 Tax=Sphingomonas jatrophae TaxID=1166337 RepID=A0A1I6K0H1_9SPHN|nr:FAD-dependent oxidoreductase [Sphingomonas jatrophae]SFR84677.1 NAD(P)-binding Rossmann-like domain-containing protein [Sphingomonas jatrophae]